MKVSLLVGKKFNCAETRLYLLESETIDTVLVANPDRDVASPTEDSSEAAGLNWQLTKTLPVFVCVPACMCVCACQIKIYSTTVI